MAQLKEQDKARYQELEAQKKQAQKEGQKKQAQKKEASQKEAKNQKKKSQAQKEAAQKELQRKLDSWVTSSDDEGDQQWNDRHKHRNMLIREGKKADGVGHDQCPFKTKIGSYLMQKQAFFKQYHASRKTSIGEGGWGKVFHCWPASAEEKRQRERWQDGDDRKKWGKVAEADEAEYARKRRNNFQFSLVVKKIYKFKFDTGGQMKSAKQLIREIRIMALLHRLPALANFTRHFPRVHAVFESHRHLWVVTDAYPRTVAQEWQNGANTRARNRQLGLEIAETLATIVAALHEAGICHGDLKPDNVMVDRAFTVQDRPVMKIVDWGSAQLTTDAKERREDVSALGYLLHHLHTIDGTDQRAGMAAPGDKDETEFEAADVGRLIEGLKHDTPEHPASGLAAEFRALRARQLQFRAGYEAGGAPRAAGAASESELSLGAAPVAPALRRAQRAHRRLRRAQRRLREQVARAEAAVARLAAVRRAARRRWPGVPEDHPTFVRHVALRLQRSQLITTLRELERVAEDDMAV